MLTTIPEIHLGIALCPRPSFIFRSEPRAGPGEGPNKENGGGMARASPHWATPTQLRGPFILWHRAPRAPQGWAAARRLPLRLGRRPPWEHRSFPRGKRSLSTAGARGRPKNALAGNRKLPARPWNTRVAYCSRGPRITLQADRTA